MMSGLCCVAGGGGWVKRKGKRETAARGSGTAWAAAAEEALVRWGPRSETWPLRAAETLRAEMALWAQQPARRLQGAWLQQWDAPSDG